MERPRPAWTLAELAQLLGGALQGPPGLVIHEAVPAFSGGPAAITFAEADKYLDQALATDVGAVLVKPGTDTKGKPCIEVAQPRAAFGRVLGLMRRPLPCNEGVHPTAVIHHTAQVASSASIGPYAVVEAWAEVREGAKVFAHAYIGEGCVVGEHSQVLPNAVLLCEVELGPRCVVYPGAVLGADGFGFHWDGTRRVKVPQAGKVRLGSDVEIGANSTVDRATCGATVLEEGVKLDNLVHIGHNCHVGAHTVMASMVGISGSVHIGKRTVWGGQAGTADHIAIADDTVLAARAGIMSSIEEAGTYAGAPAMPILKWLRTKALQAKLSDMAERIKKLEKKVGGGG